MSGSRKPSRMNARTSNVVATGRRIKSSDILSHRLSAAFVAALASTLALFRP